jgi:deazaflavin-dependent oxidoreductase (nitroreductase family)
VEENQKVAQVWLTPSLEEIPAISRAHVQALEASSDDAVWVLLGLPLIVLRTVGRLTGKEHKVALPVWRDADGVRVVVASYAGAPHHPAWYLNLTDRAANAAVQVRTQTGQYWSVADLVEGDEYPRVWAQLTSDRAWYQEYQTRTSRRIPLVRLPER